MTTQNTIQNNSLLKGNDKKKSTMKTIKLNKILLLLLAMVAFSACVQDDDFSTPDPTVVEPQLDGPVISLDAVAGFLIQQQNDDNNESNTEIDFENETSTFTFEFDSGNTYVSGYVISSDEGGNFFEELILQDNYENPTVGIKLLLDTSPLYTRYEVGRKVYVKLNNLSVGVTNGVFTIGFLNGNEVDKIPAPLEEEFIARSAEKQDLVPMPIALNTITNTMTNLFVTVEDAQFIRFEALGDNPATFAAEPLDEFDGERTLESCASSANIVFSTSTFADFKGLNLPSGRGSVNAVLTKDFFGETFNLSINTPEDINFNNDMRCDPIEISCGLADMAGATNLFEDDFESQSTNSLISGNGWTNFIEEGTEGWEAYTATGTNSSQGVSARVGSFNSGDTSSVAWLITPQIDLDANTDVTFQFESSNSFSDGSTMEVLFSNDWDGTEAGIPTATWGILSDAYVVSDDDFFGDWFESGIVDLSCASGQIYIAFKYVGSGNSDFDGTYELDFVSIDAQ